jgi:hypothetical protein
MDSFSVGNLKPSCGYLAMAALDDWSMQYNTASHGILVESLRRGFPVMFPVDYKKWLWSVKGCLKRHIV